jgi:hypothetical protein
MLDKPGYKRLFHSLQIPRLAQMVTDFRICFAPCNRSRSGHFTCKCNKFDTMLGQVLVSLENLRVLQFRCMCCPVRDRPRRHRYLEELQNIQLQRLLLRCSCSKWPSEDAVRLLTQSCMHSVTSASFTTDNLLLPPAALENSNYLPRLERLECDQMETLETLSNKKAITHLVCKAIPLDIRHFIRQNQGVLLHLSVENILHTLPSFIEADPSPYQNLRHFGTLYFSLSVAHGLPPDYCININSLQSHRDSARASMQSLSCLPHLVSIELRIFTHERLYIDQMIPYFFGDRMDRQGRGLAPIQKIYVAARLGLPGAREYLHSIWEIGPQWKSREVPIIYSQKIMDGDL